MVITIPASQEADGERAPANADGATDVGLTQEGL